MNLKNLPKKCTKVKIKNSERSIIFDKLQKKFFKFWFRSKFYKMETEEEGFISISNTLIAALHH